jgi:hypothetical protein
MLRPLPTTFCGPLLQKCELILRDLGWVASQVGATIGWRRSSVDYLTGRSPNWCSHFGLLVAYPWTVSCTDLIIITLFISDPSCLQGSANEG